MTQDTPKTNRSEIYRKAALEHLGSPERLNEMISITKPTTWLALSVVALILAGAVTWAWIGRLPTHVTGNGLMLVEGGRIFGVNTVGAGMLRELSVRVGDMVEAGQVIGQLTQNDVERDVRLAREQIEERERDLERARTVGAQEAAARMESVTRQRAAIELRITLGRQREDVLRQRLRLTETLFRDRIVTQNEVLALQQELSLILQDVSTAISERARVAAEQVELGRLAEQRVREAELALNEVTRRLERLTGGLNDTSRVIAPVSGEVKELRTVQGAMMREGQPVLTIESRGTGLEALVFIRSSRSGTAITPGMSARVAPANARREEFGTLIGEVASISDFPVSFEAIRAIINNDELARSFMSEGPPYQVIIRLERDAQTASGYRWTSSRGAGVTLGSGSTLRADVTVAFRRPIAMVIPALRDLLKL
jgi:HlyD family secretion protein